MLCIVLVLNSTYAGCPVVREVREICCFFFKVREKSGNSVKWSGKLENLRKSGNFKIMLCSTHQNLNKHIRDDHPGKPHVQISEGVGYRR